MKFEGEEFWGVAEWTVGSWGRSKQRSNGEYDQSMWYTAMKCYGEPDYFVQLVCDNKKNLRVSISVNLKGAPRFNVIENK